MGLRQMNDRLGSEYSSSEEIDEDYFRTHQVSRLYERSFLRKLERWGSFLQLASCVIAVSLDPFFLYIPVINHHEKCFHFDKKLRIAALVLRSVTDFIFMLHIAFQFLIGYVMRLILYNIDEAYEKVYKTYMLSDFLSDILSLLPLPQVLILSVIPEMKGSKSLTARNIIIALVLLQYVPRVVRIYPLYKKLEWRRTIFKKTTAWTKAAQNLFLYMLASHVIGALWYFFSIEREITCWQEACKHHPGCDHSSFFCDDEIRATEFLHHMCPVKTPNTELFDFGIFLDALQSGIVESVHLPQKLFRCLWWGLQNLSSLGQNLKTSTYVWENIFAVFISTAGMILFLFFIGNIQTYLQLKFERKEQKRMDRMSKERAVDTWMSKNQLPNRIRRGIKHSVEKKWDEIKTVDSENLIPILPMLLQKDIKHHLCSGLVKRVKLFTLMDDELLDDEMYGCLKPMVYSKERYVLRKGDPVKEMCFIFRGKVLLLTDANAGRTEFSSVELQTGDFCGEELLTWIFSGGSSTNLPVSNQTAQAQTKVEAFILTARDLISLIFYFLHWLPDDVKFHPILRCYSVHWRTWSARVIQMAWRCYAKRKLEEAKTLQDAWAKTCGTSLSIGATKEADIITALRLQKPDEPYFVVNSSYR